MRGTANYDIFLEGTCSFCRWSQAKIEPYDSNGRLRFLDYNDAAVAAQAPFPRADLDQEMHLRTPEGKWLRGFAAWLALLRVLPRLVGLPPVSSGPPPGWLGPPLSALPSRCPSGLSWAPPPHGPATLWTLD